VSRKKLKERLFIDNGKTEVIRRIEKSETQICSSAFNFAPSTVKMQEALALINKEYEILFSN
jgi:hypothetical protein